MPAQHAHTAGPWHIERDMTRGEPFLWSVRDAQGGLVFFGMEEEVARLIAAAPAMLAALEPFVAFRTARKPGKFRDPIGEHFTAEDFERLRAAIALAKGEQP